MMKQTGRYKSFTPKYRLPFQWSFRPSKYLLFAITLSLGVVQRIYGQALTVNYPGPQTYTIWVPITPLNPILTGAAPTSTGQTTITTAGTGTAGYLDGNGINAAFSQPQAIAVASSGYIYVADAVNNRIRRISPSGVVSTLAGSGSAGSVNGTGTAASFNRPAGLAVDAAGNIFVADQLNNLIRKVTPAGIVTTFAGSGVAGSSDGASTATSFYNPAGLCFDSSGNLFVADCLNNKIRKITPGGVVLTFAGNGTQGATNGTALSATFKNPSGLVMDGSGNLYVADRLNHLIRKITSAGAVTTFAGTGAVGAVNGASTVATFNAPSDVKLDISGNLFVADQSNNQIRKITPAGAVTTFAGTTTAGFVNGTGSTVRINGPSGLSIDNKGAIYITDANNNSVRKIITKPFSITPELPAGLTFNDLTGVISGTPTIVTTQQNYTITAYNDISSSSTTLNIAVSTLNYFPSARNYVSTSTLLIPNIKNNGAINSVIPQYTKVQTLVEYKDALGRPQQTVQFKGSPSGKDLVQVNVYDQLGREAVKYLPYALTYGANEAGYKYDALAVGAGQNQFYSAPPTGVSAVVYPTSTTVYEASPLSRVIEQGNPGGTWQPFNASIPASGHTIKTVYGSNAVNEVLAWSVNTAGNGVTGGNVFYAAGMLYKTTTLDENGNSSIEYTDKDNHVICKKVQASASPVTYTTTYLIFDNFDNLTYVIPPLPAGMSYPVNILETDDLFLTIMYGYHYDQRDRLVEKKIPGKGWEFTIYNKLDQIVYTQDASQRAKSPQVWTYFKYDATGRQVLSGLWFSTGITGNAGDSNIASPSRALEQYLITQATNQSPLWVVRDNTTTTGYTAIAPQGPLLTISYFDDYSFPGKPATFIAPGNASLLTKGLLTGTKKAVLNTIENPTPDMLMAVQYYDDFENVTQNYQQHYYSGILSPYNYDQVNNTYNFTNELTGSTRQHFIKNTSNSAAVSSVVIANTNIYDHMGRKTQALQSINGAVSTMLIKTDYNEIGQVLTKHLHGTSADGPFLQDIDHAYNERGWLLNINNPGTAVTPTRLFAETITYNLPTHGAIAQFNGNISENTYNSGISGNQFVKYNYDPSGRLNSGISSAGLSESNIVYDAVGNIQSLTRGANPAYIYNYTGNQLNSITGLTTSTYTYDKNGNVLHDGRNNADFSYNLLNLPQSVTGSVTLNYVYDAGGTKIRKISNGMAVDYINGIQYKPDGTIDFILTEVGRALRSGSNYIYEYTLEDHLGNNRVTFDQTNGKIGEDDYYPFGMNLHRQLNAGNKYLYNGKEIQEELTQYDFGARFYDPVIARWSVIDHKAELYFHITPYAYAANTPANAIDPNGQLVIFVAGQNKGNGATPSYWGTTLFNLNGRSVHNYGFDQAVKNHFSDMNTRYYDGALGGWRNTFGWFQDRRNIFIKDRIDAGKEQGTIDAATIIHNLARSNGVITESIKVIAHSMGAAYAKGLIEAIVKYAYDHPTECEGLKITEYDFAAFQQNHLGAIPGVTLFQIDNHGDIVVGWTPSSSHKREQGREEKGSYNNFNPEGSHGIMTFLRAVDKLEEGDYQFVQGRFVKQY